MWEDAGLEEPVCRLERVGAGLPVTILERRKVLIAEGVPRLRAFNRAREEFAADREACGEYATVEEVVEEVVEEGVIDTGVYTDPVLSPPSFFNTYRTPITLGGGLVLLGGVGLGIYLLLR